VFGYALKIGTPKRVTGEKAYPIATTIINTTDVATTTRTPAPTRAMNGGSGSLRSSRNIVKNTNNMKPPMRRPATIFAVWDKDFSMS